MQQKPSNRVSLFLKELSEFEISGFRSGVDGDRSILVMLGGVDW
jgi:hypothetical protein